MERETLSHEERSQDELDGSETLGCFQIQGSVHQTWKTETFRNQVRWEVLHGELGVIENGDGSLVGELQSDDGHWIRSIRDVGDRSASDVPAQVENPCGVRMPLFYAHDEEPLAVRCLNRGAEKVGLCRCLLNRHCSSVMGTCSFH